MTTTNDLLRLLGWPENELDKKGVMNWQGNVQNADALPPTASLMITPKIIRAVVLNVEPNQNIQPHFAAEWDITGPEPVLKKHELTGVDLSTTPSADPVSSFTSLVALISPRPKIDVLGRRQKSESASSSAPSING